MLFGLSMDYEVFLVTRMRERWDAGEDNVGAVAHGLERTGRIITAAAIIMCAAFSGFVAGRIVGLQEFGLGLAVAIFLDATIVRCLLVPSLMAILDRWNWWLPGRFARLVRTAALAARAAPAGAARLARGLVSAARGAAIASPAVKGLICAGGEARRLEELTRVTNKHLLPGRTLADGLLPARAAAAARGPRGAARDREAARRRLHRPARRRPRRLPARAGEPLFDLDLTYKVQVEPGGIAQVVGMARDFARGEKLVVCLGDNIFEKAQTEAIAALGASGALVFVKEVDDPVSFGVVAYDERRPGRDIVEKAGVVDTRYSAPPSQRRRRRPLLLPAGRLRDHRRARALEPAASSRSPTSTASTRVAASSRVRRDRGLVARRRQALGGPRRTSAA